jgi:hypothetical protein
MDYLTINDLNNGSLKHVFSYLSLKDLLIAEQVFKRWQVLIQEVLAQEFKSICFGSRKVFYKWCNIARHPNHDYHRLKIERLFQIRVQIIASNFDQIPKYKVHYFQ